MRRLVYSPKAEIDLIDIVDYVADITGDDALAYGAARRLDEQCKRLASLPGTLGRSRPDLGEGLRTFPHLGYAIVFRYVGEDTFEVTRIVSGKRNLRILLGRE